jgi:hypothetical protein
MHSPKVCLPFLLFRGNSFQLLLYLLLTSIFLTLFCYIGKVFVRRNVATTKGEENTKIYFPNHGHLDRVFWISLKYTIFTTKSRCASYILHIYVESANIFLYFGFYQYGQYVFFLCTYVFVEKSLIRWCLRSVLRRGFLSFASLLKMTKLSKTKDTARDSKLGTASFLGPSIVKYS